MMLYSIVPQKVRRNLNHLYFVITKVINYHCYSDRKSPIPAMIDDYLSDFYTLYTDIFKGSL